MVSTTAGRADLGRALLVAAMVTLQAAVTAVLDQPGRTVRAFKAMAAGTAERQRRIAATIEEQHGLLAAGNGTGQRGDQRRREEALRRQLFLAHIDHRYCRQPGIRPEERRVGEEGVSTGGI